MFKNENIEEWMANTKVTNHNIEFFQRNEFELLNKYENIHCDRTNNEIDEVYDKLYKTYHKVEYWINNIQNEVFPDGAKHIVKRPTNQGNHFDGYLWAKLYPTKQDQKDKWLAITLGLDSDYHFNIKIDTVGLVKQPELRKRYEDYRGDFYNSQIVKRYKTDDIGNWDELFLRTQKDIDELMRFYPEIKMLNASSRSPQKIPASKMNKPLNEILYGPPGTGKTYQSISKAISIVDPEYYRENKKERELLVERFKELTISNWSDTRGQIAFCTFHQSFTYEDFVEGIKPRVINEKDIIYETQKGVFKALCDRARTATNDKTDFDTVVNKLQNKVLSDGIITLQTDRGNKFDVNYTGQTTFRISPHESSAENPQYPASIENIRMLYEGAPLTDLYNPSYVKGILEYLYVHYNLPKFEKVMDNDKPYVIVIDEINRGNVASIFGELITLIELDKRSGAEEELSVILPYSKKQFTVPNNVYIIGTMNTADRSVEALDSALRRRFSFKEAMPDYKVIEKVLGHNNEWNNTQISLLLEKINKRIIRLIDRDHQIGHSYFLKLSNINKENITEHLKAIFSENIIPLLQEYFFNDFNKIGLVLGDGFLTTEDEMGNEKDENLFAAFIKGDSSNYEDEVFEIIDPKTMDDEAFKTAIKNLIN